MMRKLMISTGLLALLLGATPAFAQKRPAQPSRPAAAQPATEEKHDWSRFGGDPLASSFPEACRKKDAALDAMTNVPLAVREHFKQLLARDCGGSHDEWLTPNTAILAMSFGTPTLRSEPNVTMAELPVLKSPDGRTYRIGAVAETLKVREWEPFEYEGKIYILGDAYECFNFYIRTAPAPAKELCVTVSFNAKPTTSVSWGDGTLNGPLRPSACNSLAQGDAEAKAWYGECDKCRPPLKFIREHLGATAEVPHRYLYNATATRQTLSFTAEVKGTLLYLCARYTDPDTGLVYQSDGIYIGEDDWKGKDHIEIPDSDWTWEVVEPTE